MVNCDPSQMGAPVENQHDDRAEGNDRRVSGSSPAPLRVAWLYPLPKRRILSGMAAGSEPDQLSAISRIARYGVSPHLVDPLPFPLNPFARRHSLYSGIDALRALRVASSLRRYDVILSVGESSALVLLWLKRLLGFRTPIVVWDPALGGEWPVRERILRYVLPRADRVLVVGANQANFITQIYGGNCRVAVIHHWEDTSFFAPQHAASDGYILSVGNDVARDFATLVDAVATLPCEIVIKTNRRIKRADDLPPNVRVVAERISFEALRDLYARARFVVIPIKKAVHASGVNSILEAMAMGKATIVSDSPGICDFVRNGENSIVVPPGDPDALSRAIATLLADPTQAEKLGRRARTFVEANFSLDRFAERLAAELASAHRIAAESHGRLAARANRQ